MLRNTFCHIPGIGIKTEKDLWNQGILQWDDVLNGIPMQAPRVGSRFLKQRLIESAGELERGNPAYFEKLMPSGQSWRLFGDFRDSIAYLDIETTGLGRGLDHITTIALYDGRSVSHYVYGRNLEAFVDDIAKYKVLVTFNGKCFDIPFIENYFRIKLNQAQIDLRFVLKSMGFGGGLKGCEKRLGLDRKDLDGVNGYFAVLLWQDFEANHNEKALNTLIAYNMMDAVNLEPLAVMAYNRKLEETPFSFSHREPTPEPPAIPFEPNIDVLKKIADQVYGHH